MGQDESCEVSNIHRYLLNRGLRDPFFYHPAAIYQNLSFRELLIMGDFTPTLVLQ